MGPSRQVLTDLFVCLYLHLLLAAASATPLVIIPYPTDESKMRVQRIVKPLVTSPEFQTFSLGGCDVDAMVRALIVHLSDFEGPHDNRRHIEQHKRQRQQIPNGIFSLSSAHPSPPVSAEKSAHHLCLQKDRSANFNTPCLPVEKKLFGLSCAILGRNFP
jgi:hypothetical protein